MNEIERIKQVYVNRGQVISDNRYTYFNVGNLYIMQQREREILRLLSKPSINQLSDKNILDVGCGVGGLLRGFIKYGALPENLWGLDLLSDSIKQAREISPNIDFRCGDARQLPYEDECFDIVTAFTVFTSILDDGMKKRIASEMLRVLKSKGIILWYDFHMNNPQNPDVKGVGKVEIKRLFLDCELDFQRVTLAPPLARRLAPYSWLTCYLLEKIPFLRTHYLSVIWKNQNMKQSR